MTSSNYIVPLHHIEHWSTKVPWVSLDQVEQDLVMSRALIELYQSVFLQKTMIFRGGTALNKLFFNPPQRYSEDLDFVDIGNENYKTIISHIHEALNYWLGEPNFEHDPQQGLIRLIYSFQTSSSQKPLKLKVEVNIKEKFYLYNPILYDYSISSEWIQKQAVISVYCLEELLATKLRALYQRRKSRDLFDLDTALEFFPELDVEKLLTAFHKYTENNGNKISSEEFISNLNHKMKKNSFKNDILPFLSQEKRGQYDVRAASERVISMILSHL